MLILMPVVIVGFPFRMQNNLLQFFEDTIDVVQKDNKLGDMKSIVDVAGSNFAIRNKEKLWTDQATHASCQMVEYSSDRGIGWEEIFGKYEAAVEDGRKVQFLKVCLFSIPSHLYLCGQYKT